MTDAFASASKTEKKSTLVSRNILVLGRRTSVRLEPEMWRALREIARRENCKIHDLCSLIQMRKNPDTTLTAGIRVFVMLYFRAAATDDGHGRAGHGDFSEMMRRARVTCDWVRRESSGMRVNAETLGGGQPPARTCAGSAEA